MTGPGEPTEEALRLFEEFLERHHAGRADFDALCRGHPDHAERFRRWWEHLIESGEVSATPPPTPGGVEPDEGDRFGPYRVEREIGRGGQGAVFLAEDTRLGRSVALKVLPIARVHGQDPEKRFAREAELASRLDHPGLCTVFERGVHRNTAFLAMRYVDGATLAAFIARARRRAETDAASRAIRLPAADGGDADAIDEREAIRRVLALFEKVARALHAAHEAQLVHRDVKPGNVMVDHRGDPVVLDFGLARDVGEEGPALTRTGDAVGTPAYMSPEQVHATGAVDRRSDVYGLGATLYECLTLRRPVEAATRAELYRRVVDVEPPRARRLNRALSRDVETILDTALQKQPGARYWTAEDFAEDLRRVRERRPILARPAGPLVRGWRWAQRNRAVAASLLALFVALAGGLAVSLVLQAETRRAQREERQMLGRLTDGVKLDEAERVAAGLFPIRASRAGDLGAWLSNYGEPLAVSLLARRAERDSLRARALPATDAELAAARAAHPLSSEIARLRSELEQSRRQMLVAPNPNRRRWFDSFAQDLEARIADRQRLLDSVQVWRFAESSDRALHDGLSDLVARLEEFVARNGLLERMRAHREWAASARARVDGEYSDGWLAGLQWAARRDGPYRGLVLAPQPGLVPLGTNAAGLLEFAFERSGTIPARDPDTDRLQLDDDSAIVLVLVPGTTYRMGRLDAARQPEERFERDAVLDPFLIAKHELSRRQWQTLSGEAPPDDPVVSVAFELGPGHPVDFVSWYEASAVLHEFGLELPTEAQWEYAASGGRHTSYWWEKRPPPRDAILDNLRDREFAAAVGKSRPRWYDDGFAAVARGHEPRLAENPFGLTAVHGNVAEWCRDPYLPRIPLDEFEMQSGDGLHLVPRLGTFAVRGGRFDSPKEASYVSARHGLRGGVGHIAVGVRPVWRLP